VDPKLLRTHAHLHWVTAAGYVMIRESTEDTTLTYLDASRGTVQVPVPKGTGLVVDVVGTGMSCVNPSQSDIDLSNDSVRRRAQPTYLR